jgi:hypothetical protein
MPKDKTPKADASKDKLITLRESGYKGWIDENGDKTTYDAWAKKHGVTR